MIHEYASGEQLLSSHRSDVDVVLLDVEMGGQDGFETARAIRDRDESLVFSTAAGAVRLPLPNITYLECSRHKIIVHALEGMYEFTGTLKSFLPKLTPRGFVPANSCYLVNMRYVTAVGKDTCTLRDSTRLAVSRRRRPALLQSFADYA